jgi:hypothetical protein
VPKAAWPRAVRETVTGLALETGLH